MARFESRALSDARSRAMRASVTRSRYSKRTCPGLPRERGSILCSAPVRHVRLSQSAWRPSARLWSRPSLHAGMEARSIGRAGHSSAEIPCVCAGGFRKALPGRSSAQGGIQAKRAGFHFLAGRDDVSHAGRRNATLRFVAIVSRGANRFFDLVAGRGAGKWSGRRAPTGRGRGKPRRAVDQYFAPTLWPKT